MLYRDDAQPAPMLRMPTGPFTPKSTGPDDRLLVRPAGPVYQGLNNKSTPFQRSRSVICRHFQDCLGASRSVIINIWLSEALLECLHTNSMQDGINVFL